MKAAWDEQATKQDSDPESDIDAGEDQASALLHIMEAGKTVLPTKLPAKLKWKVDFMIMPFFIVIYFLQFLDKSLLNYAAIMGIKKNLRGNEFSNLGTIFYVGYIATEPFAAVLIQKLPIAKFLGVNVCCWGVVVSVHACTETYAGLMVVRVLLGIFEASVACCLINIMGLWWTKMEQSRRICLWFMQIGVAQIVGSLMSFGFQHVHSTTLESWQIMFIFMGVITFVCGILTIIFLPDNPLNCRFLNEEEKEQIMDHIRCNQTGFENKTYKFHQVKEMLMEIETWIMFFVVIFSLVDGGGLNVFSSQIIKSFGFSNEISALIQIPMGFVSIISAFLCCYVTSYFPERALMLAIVTIPSIVGAGLYIGLDDHYKVGKLFGVYLLGSNAAVIALAYAWNTSNTAGYTKRTAKNAMILMGFCIGNLIGPQLFQSTDAPEYKPAKIVLLVFLCAVLVLALILRYIVARENKRRDILCQDMTDDERYRDVLMLDLTDRENINFRYTY